MKVESISINLIEMKMIIREYSGQIYTNKLDNLDEMDKFLARHKVPKLTQKEIDNLSRSTRDKEFMSVWETE